MPGGGGIRTIFQSGVTQKIVVGKTREQQQQQQQRDEMGAPKRWNDKAAG